MSETVTDFLNQKTKRTQHRACESFDDFYNRILADLKPQRKGDRVDVVARDGYVTTFTVAEEANGKGETRLTWIPKKAVRKSVSAIAE